MRGHVHPVVWESTGDGWDNDFPEEQQTGIMSFIQEGLTGCSRRTGATGARWQTTQDIQSSVSAIENKASPLWADADYYFICLAVGNATARRAGIVICKGNHPSWWEACLRVWLTDWVNEWSLKCVLAGVCLLFFQKASSMLEAGRDVYKNSNFLSSENKGKYTFVLKWCHPPPAVWRCLLFFTSTAGRELLAAARAPLLPAAEPSRLRQSWEHLYSGHKRTMKRFLTAALCQLAAATGSSECKLRTSTINKAMSNRVCTCSTPVCVRAAML